MINVQLLPVGFTVASLSERGRWREGRDFSPQILSRPPYLVPGRLQSDQKDLLYDGRATAGSNQSFSRPLYLELGMFINGCSRWVWTLGLSCSSWALDKDEFRTVTETL
mmetsp:Transcript_16762/g.38559  ORF Transcript_16762/g.38559 Transcript_16762/m.38559 type:complete len:109 (+) Transcript_16762:842-1168(+)